MTTEGVCPNDEEKGQIGRSNVVEDAGDDGNGGSTAQTASGLTEHPAACYRPRRSRVHLGNVGLG
jgi:hypothetical protein